MYAPAGVHSGQRARRPGARSSRAAGRRPPPGDLLPQCFDRNRFSAPGASDHCPESLGAIEKEILDVIVVDRLDCRHRAPVAGDDDHVLFGGLECLRKMVPGFEYGHRLHDSYRSACHQQSPKIVHDASLYLRTAPAREDIAGLLSIAETFSFWHRCINLTSYYCEAARALPASPASQYLHL
jgi:hypothetical protein